MGSNWPALTPAGRVSDHAHNLNDLLFTSPDDLLQVGKLIAGAGPGFQTEVRAGAVGISVRDLFDDESAMQQAYGTSGGVLTFARLLLLAGGLSSWPLVRILMDREGTSSSIRYDAPAHRFVTDGGANEPLKVDQEGVTFSMVDTTIAAGAITVTSSFHRVDTEAAAATDDLATINGGSNGTLLILKPFSSARTVVVKDGTGNLHLAGDFSLTNTLDTIMLVHVNGLWLEISRSDNAA